MTDSNKLAHWITIQFQQQVFTQGFISNLPPALAIPLGISRFLDTYNQ
jgi:hypothetical protein